MATELNANLPDDPNDPLAPRPRPDDVPAQPAGDPDLLIHAIGLHSYYGASHILKGIDFAVRRGETIGLMGRNGMGKSTLLKSIMGRSEERRVGKECRSR